MQHFLLLRGNTLSPRKNDSLFYTEIASSYRKAVYKKTRRFKNPILKGFFSVQRIETIIRVANDSQEKFSISNVLYQGFLCYLDLDGILLHGSCWKAKD